MNHFNEFVAKCNYTDVCMWEHTNRFSCMFKPHSKFLSNFYSTRLTWQQSGFSSKSNTEFHPIKTGMTCCWAHVTHTHTHTPTLWGSSVKFGRSRLPASAWLSWSTSYMLYDGFPISTFIPPLVMGCLCTRLPLSRAEHIIINATHNMLLVCCCTMLLGAYHFVR